ncbi:MAG TPA: hypothetical protein VGL56_20980 [Fimbriimonadaceae bacterium]|jgi:hypothetical protein
MSRNIIHVPSELWQSDFPLGYDCNLYVGRMTGRLQPMATNQNFSEFSFEMHDPLDPTEFVLRYTTLEAPAQELARWENAGDTVGIVMAYRGQKMAMVMAYNFTRRKWFGTDYYPHAADKRPLCNMSIRDSHNLTMIAVPLLCTCIGIALLPMGLYANFLKSAQYRVLNPTNYRGVTSKRIADWITSNANSFASNASPALDPSL